MVSIAFKRGDTFLIQCAVTESAVAKDLTGFTVRAMVKKGTNLIAELVHTWVSQVGGTFKLSCADTSAWPVATLLCDIEYTDGSGIVRSTETFQVVVSSDVTTPVVP